MTANGQHLHTLMKLAGRYSDDAKAKWAMMCHMARFDARRKHRAERLRIAAAKADRWRNRYAV